MAASRLIVAGPGSVSENVSSNEEDGSSGLVEREIDEEIGSDLFSSPSDAPLIVEIEETPEVEPGKANQKNFNKNLFLGLSELLIGLQVLKTS